MASRAMWKGSISFGLVTIPIGLFSAVAARGELAFNLLHKKDGRRIVERRFCKAEDVEVPWADIVRGYQYSKDQYVVVTDEDFEKAQVPATHIFEIRAFVKAIEVQDLYFDHPYYAAPRGRAGVKAYALLRGALADTRQLAVGTVVLGQREHLAALEPYEDALVMTTMRFAHEIRSPRELDVPPPRTGWTDKEMKLTRQLMDVLSDTWKPEAYRDTYSDVLREVIAAKVEGKEMVIPEMPKRPRVVSLMEALQKSLDEGRRPLDRALGRGTAVRRRHRRARPRTAA